MSQSPSVEAFTDTQREHTFDEALVGDMPKDEEGEAEGQTTTSKVLALFQKFPHKTFTVREIITELGAHGKTVHGAVWRLTNESKKIGKAGRGKYRLKTQKPAADTAHI